MAPSSDSRNSAREKPVKTNPLPRKRPQNISREFVDSTGQTGHWAESSARTVQEEERFAVWCSFLFSKCRRCEQIFLRDLRLIISPPHLFRTQSHRQEAKPVYGGGTIVGESAPVAWGGIAFVACQIVVRKKGVPLVHAGVPANFSNDRRGGNGPAPGISPNQWFLFDRKVNLNRINEQIIGPHAKSYNCPLHRQSRCLVNVDLVDFERVRGSDGPIHAFGFDLGSQSCASLGIKDLAIAQTCNLPVGIENDCCGKNRAEKRATAHFVNPCHSGIPLRPS
jgi:hypothetical protein